MKLLISELVLLGLLGQLTGVTSDKGYQTKEPQPNNSTVTKPGLERKVKFTYYWIAVEAEFPTDKGTPTTELKKCNGDILKRVSQEFQKQVKMEGSGILSNGQFINCSDDECECFETVNSAKGSSQNPLNPYTSVATNDLAFGMKLFVKELNGTTLPFTNQTHNGCVQVDDRSWSFDDKQIDWYVFDHRYYNNYDERLNITDVNITLNSTCELLNYTVPTNVINSHSQREDPLKLLWTAVICWFLHICAFD